MKPEQFSPYMQKKMLSALSGSMNALAATAVTWSKDRLRQKNWVDRSAEAYLPRQNKKAKGSLMIVSGRLLRSIRKFSVNPTGFEYGSRGVPYARVHNDGGLITRHARSETFTRNRNKRGRFKRGTTPGRGFTFGGGSFNMPQRKFLGKSFILESILRRKAQIEMIRRMRR